MFAIFSDNEIFVKKGFLAWIVNEKLRAVIEDQNGYF
jgi:hypothetical protein